MTLKRLINPFTVIALLLVGVQVLAQAPRTDSCVFTSSVFNLEDNTRVDEYSCQAGPYKTTFQYERLLSDGQHTIGEWREGSEYFIHVLDKEGKEVIPVGQYDHINFYRLDSKSDREESYFLVGRLLSESDEAYCFGVLDNHANTVIPVEYRFLESLGDHERFITQSCTEDTGLFIIDEAGQRVAQGSFDTIERAPTVWNDRFFLKVMKNNLYGLLDIKTGELVFEAKYEVLGLEYDEVNFQPNLSTAKFNGRWGALNLDGQVVVPFVYEHIMLDPENLVKSGLDNADGKTYFLVVDGDSVKQVAYKQGELIDEKAVPNLYSVAFTQDFLKSAYPDGAYVPKEFSNMKQAYFGIHEQRLKRMLIPVMLVRDNQAEVPFVFFERSELSLGDFEDTQTISLLDNGFQITIEGISRFDDEKINTTLDFVKTQDGLLCEACKDYQIPREWVRLKRP
ncbi:WG repeat-containing protein [Suttonella sp. R2A3]|uniref:WG repeat-containing protein n=1 Tax=Suttonella sp. R2A3 TaxID=2908648 RepID=UPI001F2E41CE|nr:WG repeat-containing protein [Suttonella sp. R2A3]UJF24881.1 WG repeat-containing protein [Suttonella sp. R2A3]